MLWEGAPDSLCSWGGVSQCTRCPTLIFAGSPGIAVEHAAGKMPGTTPFYAWTSLGSAHSLRPDWRVEGEDLTVKPPGPLSGPMVRHL